MNRILAVVSLKRIQENARLIKRFSRSKLIAVVKDDAYGHGAVRVAHALTGIADAFAVASVEEGVELRTAGITADVIVLTPCLSVEEGVRLISYHLIASVSSLASLRFLQKAEKIAGQRVRAHLAVNTGMNRYGVRPEHVARFCGWMQGRLEGVYSHLYAAESKRAVFEQTRSFGRAAAVVKAYYPRALCHIAATGGALARVKSDAVRAGIALYGYLPEGFAGKLSVKPAMKIYATVSHETPRVGGGAGYMRAEKRYAHFYTLRMGYGDGFFRAGCAGVIGKLCMDACVAEGSASFGKRRLIMRNVSAYAKAHGTSEYEVLVRIGAHAEKAYCEKG